MRSKCRNCQIVKWAALIVMIVLSLYAASLALAHEWYPADCCSGQDCGPIPDYRVGRTADGDYVIDGRWIFERSNRAETRDSMSGNFHACFPQINSRPKCIFVPPEGM